MAHRSTGVLQLVTSGDMSADIISTVLNIQDIDNVAMELVWTGTPTGTFTVECSLDYNPFGAAGNGTWVALTLSPSPVASGAAGNTLIDMTQLGSPYIRVHYTHSSGSGTLQAYAFGKVLS